MIRAYAFRSGEIVTSTVGGNLLPIVGLKSNLGYCKFNNKSLHSHIMVYFSFVANKHNISKPKDAPANAVMAP